MPRLIFGLLIALTSVWSAHAADLTDQIQKRYDTLQSFRAFFLQTLTNASSRETQERLGTIVFVRPRRGYRAGRKRPGAPRRGS